MDDPLRARHRAHRRARSRALRWALVSLLVCLSVVAALVQWSVVRERVRADAVVASQGGVVADRWVDAVERVENRLESVGALFRSSDFVSAAEFGTFVGDIGLQEGMRAIAYIALVEADDLDGFVAETRRETPSYTVFALDEAAQPIPLDRTADQHLLVVYMEPAKEFSALVGADTLTLSWLQDALRTTMATGSATLSPPWPSSDGSDGVTALFHPVYMDGELDGIVAGVIDPPTLLAAAVHSASASAVSWSLVDVGPNRAAAPVAPETAWSRTVQTAGRVWRVDVVPAVTMTSTWPMERAAGAAAGILASLAIAVAVYVAFQRAHGRRENSRLAALGEQKDMFLAAVSHELRTPLTAVVGFIEEVSSRWEVLDPDERADLLNLAGDEAAEMAALVDDLLVGARLETGNPLAVTAHSLDLVDEVRWVSRRLARARGDGVEIDGEGWALGDRVRIRQILRNVIDNAFKHGRPPVTVTVESDEDWCTVWVGDAGDGVPECCHQAIFDSSSLAAQHDHVRVSNSNRLGLPVSAYLAGLMGGDLTYDADSKRFRFRLPVSEATERSTAPGGLRDILVG
jgi:signal transduction histidine kinase